MKNLKTRRGAALLTAIAFAAIAAFLIAGGATLIVSQKSRAAVEADYSAAIQLADAGINYELRFIRQNIFNPDISPENWSHQSTNKGSGTITGVPGSFEVWVEDASTGGVWTPPGKVKIIAVGTVNGISRKIEAQAEGGEDAGIFDGESIFADKEIVFQGSDSTINGSVTTNGDFVSPSTGYDAVDGNIVLANRSDDSGATGSNVTTQTDPVFYPTVDYLVSLAFPGGWDWLTSNSPVNRANPNARKYNEGETTLSPTTTSSEPLGLIVKNPVGDKAILPPGDYYFTDIDLSGGKVIVIDNLALSTGGTPGPVTIWMNDSNSKDIINVDVDSAAQDPSQFRIFYNKQSEVRIAGTSDIYATFYSITSGGSADFEIHGDSAFYGSVIADTITIGGNSQIFYPSPGGGGDDFDLVQWYGFKNQWKELKINDSGKVFADGTDN